MDAEIFFVGIDLGTFKTSVASSNGSRDVFYSAVGWPRDHLARLLLGRDVVFGNDIVEQRLALHVVRPFEKGVLKYNNADTHLSQGQVEKHKEAARLLVEHAVARTRPPKGARVFGIIGAPARANVMARRIILEAAQHSFDAAMIASEPFLVAYGMDRLHDTLVIDIGAGTIDLCPVYGVFPKEEDQVTLPVGGDFIDEHFFHAMHRAHPQAQLSLNMAREIKEKYGSVHEGNERVLVTLPVNGTPTPIDVGGVLKEACRVIVPPIIEGLRELIGRFDPEFQQRMLHNILLSGGGSMLRGLDRVIEESLRSYGGGRVRKANDAVFAGAVGALKLATGMPAHAWEHFEFRPSGSVARAA
jgi:rod shape-determining protein MreB